jgi:hypothetical protein
MALTGIVVAFDRRLLGLGLAYAGSGRADVLELLLSVRPCPIAPAIMDSPPHLEIR